MKMAWMFCATKTIRSSPRAIALSVAAFSEDDLSIDSEVCSEGAHHHTDLWLDHHFSGALSRRRLEQCRANGRLKFTACSGLYITGLKLRGFKSYCTAAIEMQSPSTEMFM